MPKYLIKPGYSYRDGAGVVRTAGEEIDLDDDVVRMHPNSVQPVPEESEAGPEAGPTSTSGDSPTEAGEQA